MTTDRHMTRRPVWRRMTQEQREYALLSRANRPTRPFIFGVGVTSTGQSSLAVALEMLGFVTRQWLDGCRESSARWMFGGDRALLSGVAVGGYAAWVDWPTFIMDDLCKTYSGRLWIATTREPEDWWPSAARRWAWEYRRMDKRGLGLHGCAQMEARRRLYGAMFPSRKTAVKGYLRHMGRVRDMADAGERVCWLDTKEEHKWDILCGFLDLPKPPLPYPRVNASPEDRRGRCPSLALLAND